ncbi:hypothetical protein LCGC14_2882950 [marine sediment metagenome]|uniref:Uncharacterized protein n=1 Tax=marine sediment metagenome TaxID=412755 RepID=A0A0F9A7J0_9ZZZZ
MKGKVMKKNLKIRVRNSCAGHLWDFGLCDGRKLLLGNTWGWYERKGNAIRNAKAMAKRIGIKYDPEIIKEHGC